MKKNNNIVDLISFIKSKFIKFFKILTKHLFALVICLFAFYGFISMFLRSDFVAIDSCLDTGGVWDYKQMKCREDCVTWNWKYGCVPIPDDDKLEDYLYGYCVGKENELNICKAVRLELERRKLSNGTLERDAKK